MADRSSGVYEHLKHGIIRGDFALGERLGEADLAQLLGVSRTPVREALRLLDTEGLVEFMPNRGARVATWSEADLEEIFQVRCLIEPAGAGLAAQRADADDIATLEALQQEMEAAAHPGAAQDLPLLSELTTKFHLAVAEASRNKRFLSIVQQSIQLPLVVKTVRSYSLESFARTQRHHAEIIEAIKAGDPGWASSLMCAHIRSGRGDSPKGD